MFASVNQTVSRFVIGTVGTAICATVCLLGATAPAHAATVGKAATRVVSYADLDLGSDAGRATLDRRIRSAAHAVCPTGDSLTERVRTARCVREAVAGALPKVAVAISGNVG